MEGTIEVSQGLDLSPEERIQRYFDVITTSSDPEEVRSVDNLYSSVFETDPPGIKSWEDFTSRLAWLLDDEGRQAGEARVNELFRRQGSSLRVPKVDPAVELPYARIGAITHLVRSMVQGNNAYPVDDFPDVIDRAVLAIQTVDPKISEAEAKKYLRAEIKEVWEPYELQSYDEWQRAEEAHRLVSGSYQHRMTKMGMGAVRKLVVTASKLS
jgi:hypothetical protein